MLKRDKRKTEYMRKKLVRDEGIDKAEKMNTPERLQKNHVHKAIIY